MAPAVALRDVGIRFRMWRRNRAGQHAPRLAFGEKWRLWGIRHLSLEAERGELLGIIGSNGAGKTTLLMTVAGLYRPDEGEADVHGRVAPLLTPTAGLLFGLSGWDNLELAGVLLGLSRQETRELMPAVAEFTGLGEFLDAPVRTYSAGMRARLGFAAAVHCRPDIVLLDEMMAVGDQDFREQSRAKIQELRAGGATILLASHELDQLAETADRIVRLENGTVVDVGDPSAVVARYLEAHGGRPPPRQARSVGRGRW